MKIRHRVSQVVSEERSFRALVPPTNSERGKRLPPMSKIKSPASSYRPG